MTAIFPSDPSHDMQPDQGAPGSDSSTLDLAEANASIREGVLMVFGPEGDPLPPQAVIALAARQPGAGLAFGEEARIPADRIAAVLAAQTRGPLAPGASDADAASWIEGMLGLGEDLEDEADPWPDAGAEDESVGLEGSPEAPPEDAPGFELSAEFTADALEPWSPDPLDLEIPETNEVAPFDPFEFEPDGPEPGELEPGGLDPDPPSASEQVQNAGEERAREQAEARPGPAAAFLPVGEEPTRPDAEPVGPQPTPADDRTGSGVHEEHPELDCGAPEPDDRDQQAGLQAAVDDELHAEEPAEDGLAPADGDVDTDAVAEETPGGEPLTEDGALGLPQSLVLERDGVLGLGCLAEAAAQIEGPILYARIEGVPDGAILTMGRDEGNGTWSLTADDLARVSLLASRNLADFRLRLLLTSGERGDLRDGLNVTVARPEPLAEGDASFRQRTRRVPLIFKPPLSPQNDVRHFALIQVGGVPASASLSAGATDEAGTWLIAPSDLTGLEIRLASDAEEPIALKARAIAVDERDGTITTVEQDLVVTPAEGEDARPLPLRPGRNPADGRPLDLLPVLEEVGGEAGLTAIAIGGVAGGAGLSAGTFDDETGAWVLRPDDLAGLRLEACDEELLPLHLKITAVRVDPETGGSAARSTSITIERDPSPIDLPAREARPGGVGFFRPIARRRQLLSA